MICEDANRLLRAKRLEPAAAGTALPEKPGLYALFIDAASALSEPYSSVLCERGSGLLYVGRAKDSLRKRAFEEELRHQRAATFFRSLGAVLGYLPPAGSLRGKANSRNYRFSQRDTERIIAWIDEHVTVATLMMVASEIAEVEARVIAATKPLLNLSKNAWAMPELRAARARCVGVARGTITR